MGMGSALCNPQYVSGWKEDCHKFKANMGHYEFKAGLGSYIIKILSQKNEQKKKASELLKESSNCQKCSI